MTGLLETIGPYKILKELGKGGFATVYLAQKDFDEVALKVLNPSAERDPNLVKRFEREALTVAKLNHPNIIRIFDTGHDEETFFIAMEYIPGGNLRDRIKTGPLSRQKAVHIVKCIGAALTCAHTHESQIIHRDLKPENILLNMKQELEWPVLTDFGLAKPLSERDMTSITSTGSVLGSYKYMSPEQWNRDTLTPLTDLYALAIIFFEMLAGQHPFEANFTWGLMPKHLIEPLPLLSSVACDLGKFFDEVLLQATAKNPVGRFQSVADFIKAIEAANDQAEQADQERYERQKHAASAVNLTQAYIQKGSYNPSRALEMIDAALEFDPGYVEALRLKGKIYLDHQQFAAALEIYRQAYEQVRCPSSETGIDYLQVLRKVADISWQGYKQSEAVERYHEIMRVLGEGDYGKTPIQEIWKEARSRMIEYHYVSGEKAYADGNPANLDEAIEKVEYEKQILAQLKVESKIDELNYWCRSLQIKRYKEKIKLEEKDIRENGSQGTPLDFKDESLFQHYRNIDQYYQNLLDLEPENFEWKASRFKKLKEQAERRRDFAIRAENDSGPDYEAAVRHYKVIGDIEQAYYPDLSEELNLNLSEKMADLEKKADYYNKYCYIRSLMSQEKHLEALSQLEADFIGKGNYEYRDVAQMLWELVYAKQHGGQFPLGWDGVSNLEILSEGLVRAERARLELLKVALTPWSNFSELIAEQYGLLSTYEAEIGQMEARLNEAEASLKIAGHDDYRDELVRVKDEVRTWRAQLQQVEANTPPPRIEAWLQKIEQIEASLKEYYQVEEIQKIFSQNDIELTAIEEDPLFAVLQTLAPTSLEVRQNIHKIQGQLTGVLVQNINHMNEELTEVKSWQQKLNQQHELNRYLIPVSLALALLAGGIVSLQSQNDLSNPSVVMAVIALILLLVYFGYYIWTYYFSQSAPK